MEAVIKALAPLHSRLRGQNIPSNLPLVFDRKTINLGLNFILITDFGPVDLLGEVQGIGGYVECRLRSEKVDLCDLPCHVLTVDALIVSKRSAGRAKDQPVILELEAIREIKGRR